MTAKTAKIAIAAVLGALVIVAAAYHAARSEPSTPAAAAVQPSGEASGKGFVENSGTTLGDTPAPAAQSDVSSAQTVFVPGEGDVEYEMIGDLKVRKDRHCDYVVDRYITHEDGTVSPAYRCVPRTPRPVDVYTTYSTEALESLSYADAQAAHVLSQRFRETDFSRAIAYALRSSAIADNTNAVQWLLNTYPTSAQNKDNVRTHVIEDNYVLSGVYYALGGSGTPHLNWKELAKRHSADGIDSEALDLQIAELLNTYENTRIELGKD